MFYLNTDEKIKNFISNTFGEMLVLDLEGKPYFPAHFIAGLLQHDISAIIKVCILEEPYVVKYNMWYQTGVSAFNSPILTPIPTLFVDEDNVRRLVTEMSSDKKEEFEKWVFEEIIPTFKKN